VLIATRANAMLRTAKLAGRYFSIQYWFISQN